MDSRCLPTFPSSSHVLSTNFSANVYTFVSSSLLFGSTTPSPRPQPLFSPGPRAGNVAWIKSLWMSNQSSGDCPNLTMTLPSLKRKLGSSSRELIDQLVRKLCLWRVLPGSIDLRLLICVGRRPLRPLACNIADAVSLGARARFTVMRNGR